MFKAPFEFRGTVTMDSGHCNLVRPENPDRLDSAVRWRGAPDTRQDTGCHAGFWWVAKLQRGEPDADAGPLDADADHPQPILGGQGLSGI